MTPYYQDDWVTIYHGDCLEVSEWSSADVLVTDPPYGIGVGLTGKGKFAGVRVTNDHSTTARDVALAMWGDKPALVFGTWKQPRPERTRHLLVWEKGDHVGMGNLAIPWRPNLEEIYVMGDGFRGHRGSSLLRFNAPSPNFIPEWRRYHPTEKPERLMQTLIAKCPLGTIADPFMGSGSTLRAAKNLSRRAIGIEIEERYCEIAAKRCAQEVIDFGAVA